METITAFTSTVVCLSILAVVAEFAISEGPLKQTVSVSVGLVFLSAVVEQIVGIFTRMGV
ncbi:MAG: hypothetical protein RRZ24_05915 [Clostridia bacterium]